MSHELPAGIDQLSDREKRLLDRLSEKYRADADAPWLRGYVIAAVVLGGLFALARWIAWWPLALLACEVAGLLMFRQYKRFATFKSRLLAKTWRALRAGERETQ